MLRQGAVQSVPPPLLVLPPHPREPTARSTAREATSRRSPGSAGRRTPSRAALGPSSPGHRLGARRVRRVARCWGERRPSDGRVARLGASAVVLRHPRPAHGPRAAARRWPAERARGMHGASQACVLRLGRVSGSHGLWWGALLFSHHPHGLVSFLWCLHFRVNATGHFSTGPAMGMR